jgi:hypothetical protein
LITWIICDQKYKSWSSSYEILFTLLLLPPFRPKYLPTDT